MRILIADDEQVILDGLCTIIKRIYQYHIDIYKASNGEEAIKLMNSIKPHMAIVDINMPKVDGLHVLENASKWKLCDRCIILTGYDEFQYAQTAIRYGVKDYLLKPVKKDYLIELIEQTATEIGEPKLEDMKKTLAKVPFLSLQIDITNASDEMKKIIDYINKNYSQDISLSYIGTILNKHPNYVSTQFKKNIGITFSHYLQWIRLKKAAYMINNNKDMSIKDIAIKVGYQNPREFFKIFKKRLEMTPSQFKEMYSSDEQVDR